MKEEFLHYLWKYSLYYADKLIDSEGNKIVVIHPGEYNRDSGPDFFNARIRIAGTFWAGNVEIHVKASDFDNHGHNTDPAYDNVILHAVAVNDKPVFNTKGEELLTVQLEFEPALYDKYIDLVNNPVVIACQSGLKCLDDLYVRQWLSSMAIERLEEKTERIKAIYMETGCDWEETFYRVLARYFGFRVNTEPFEMLASALPFRIIRKHADNRFQVEVLLFGTAGLLDEKLFSEAVADDYYRELVREYRILSAKYSLHPLHGWIWKFARLRPANFPTVRLSQLAAMLTVAGGLFSRVLEVNDLTQLKKLFEVKASAYWDDHYVFGRKSRANEKTTGSQATDIFLVNAVTPVIFVYGRYRDEPQICEKAIRLLEEIDPEENSIVVDWRSAGIHAGSAFYTQALIHLRNNYCKKRKCLDCRIGARLISQGLDLKRNDELMLEP